MQNYTDRLYNIILLFSSHKIFIEEFTYKTLDKFLIVYYDTRDKVCDKGSYIKSPTSLRVYCSKGIRPKGGVKNG